jgi:hypothetical protein
LRDDLHKSLFVVIIVAMTATPSTTGVKTVWGDGDSFAA